jgi:branched-chain amino acid transport system substrate-binding protein
LRIREVIAALTASALVVELVALGGAVPAQAAGAKAPVNVGLIYSKTGLLSSYGAQYAEGFAIGLDYATHHTGMAGGHKIVVTERDDATDPTKAVAAAKELIGQGYKIIGGSTSSGAAIQLAPLAKENNVLFVSGAAAADAVTGNNRNTFRSGRQTYQDVLTAGTIIGTNMRGKKVIVFAQESTFGQANVSAVRAVLGGNGADVSAVLAPPSANDFAPFAQKIKDGKPDLLFPAWAGATAPAMWKALDDSGMFGGSTRVVSGLDQRSSYETLGSAATKIQFLSHYFYRAPKNRANDALVAALKKSNRVPDLFHPDGFVAAEMIVHAVEKADGDDVGKMISALENWTFDAPKGTQRIRAEDHAMLQPMFVAKLEGSGASMEPHLVRTIPLGAVSPPVKPFK